jgi:uncharacterized membrane protein
MKTLFLTAALLVLTQTAHAEIKGYGCVGTEPFFTVEVRGQNLRYSAPADEFKAQVSKRKDAMGMSEGYVSVYQNKKLNISVTVLEGKCTDGMSDTEYSKHLVFVKGESVLYGCCEPLAQDND